MKKKSFLDLTPAQRDAAVAKFEQGEPIRARALTKSEKALWKRARIGRPRKAVGEKSVPVLITVDPQLLKAADLFAKQSGQSRSQFIANAMKNAMGSKRRAS